MKNFYKNKKGISLIALTIAVVVILILSNIVIYNVRDNLGIQNLKSMQTDIGNLRDKVSSYYADYGKIPAKIKYTNLTNLRGIISDKVDTGDFYVIDLSAIENVTLTYGKDYEKIKDKSELSEEINNLEDLYIINESSHNIFYVKGVNIDGIKYYTDYTQEEKDTQKVELKYIDNVKIPDGYIYISGNKQTGIIIQKQDDENDTLEWIVVENKITDVPEELEIQTGKEEEFIESVNLFNGYYKNQTNNNIIVLPVNNFSKEYDKTSVYKDKNDDIAYIPNGFKVSKDTRMNTINQGLVIKDSNDNEYVWIRVPKVVLNGVGNSDEYDKIEQALRDYTKDYRTEEYTDTWIDGCGLTEDEYNVLKQKMLKSIYENNGFYIARYEAGTTTPKISGNGTESFENLNTNYGLPQSKKDLYLYNFVNVNQAEKLANALSNEDYTVSLMFGIQWDLVCKFMEESGELTKKEIIEDSTNWGNYAKSAFKLTKGYYINADTYNVNYTEVTTTINKENHKYYTSTGISERNKILNIYDFAGNAWEWTLSNSGNTQNSYITRGGEAYSDYYPAATVLKDSADILYSSRGFRVTLYK